MRAIHFDKPGPPEVMKVINVDIPVPNKNQILIKVKAAGINRPDLIQREGNYPAPEGHSKILGLEVSGLVEKVGDSIKNFSVGDEVAALVNGGGYAEYCLADAIQTFKKPKNLSFEQASSIPECFFTAWSNIVDRGKLKENQKILIHGGTSGVGLAAIQISQLFNSTIVTTVGNLEKKKFCENIGVDHVINYNEKDFLEEIKKIYKDGLDIILDIVGGDYVSKNLNLLNKEGKLINIGFQKGSKVELNLIKIMLNRLTFTGSTLRIRNSSFKAKILDNLKKFVFPFLEKGKIKCFIDSEYDLDNVINAHKRLYQGKHIGKVILKV